MTDDLPNEDDGALVAVVGMAGRFPGARDLNEFWSNVASGVESVRFFTDDELAAMGETAENLRDPSYVRACPVLDDIDQFDGDFFGFTPRESAITDPQHRIFLETAWTAMEHAALVPERYSGVVGVFATCGLNAYLMHHLVTNPELMETVGEWLLRHTGNDMNFLATRAAYEFDLRGPAMNVQTACSSSLVAIHQAVQSLLARECDAALAGGATISFPLLGYRYREGEILSADGHCRPFDARASGTLFGSGTGVVVLKRLADAKKDGDTIFAVVRGSAVNNDGSRKLGYLAPSVDGQASAIAEALAISGVSPEEISYVETHGTGTLVGDPIELSALIQAYRGETEKKGYCAIGSLKGNIGHLGEAAGVAGFIKTVLAIHHREIPPSLHYETPNPAIDFASSPFFVNAQRRPWEADVRRAGITALGAGGTNAHVILEEAPVSKVGGPSRAVSLLTLSARTPTALDAATKNLAACLRAEPGLNLADVAYTLQVGRRSFMHRRSLVVRDTADAIALLEGSDPTRVATHAVPITARRELVFMFAGGGAQYAGMGRELYDTEPTYRAAVDECLEVARGEVSEDLRALLFPPPGGEDAATTRLEAPSRALPALFTTAYATAKLLISFGLEPAAMIGHSMGEYVAACLAEVISVRDAIRLVAIRGRLFETLPAGGMLVVPLSAEDTRKALPDFDRTLSIAAVNAPELCVASGPPADLERLAAALTARDVETKRVHISVAAHSSMLDPILAPFEEFVRRIKLSPPQKPYVSNLTGTWIRASDATDPTYWVKHLRHTVRFADGMAAILEKPGRVVVEVGPGRTLASLARAQTQKPAATLSTLPHAKEAESAAAFFLRTLGEIWTTGIEPKWDAFYEREERRRVTLPTYAFDRKRHWVDRPLAGAATTGSTSRSLKKKPDVADWFWTPAWKRTGPPTPKPKPAKRLVVGSGDIADALRKRWPDAAFVGIDEALAAIAKDAPSQIVHLGALGVPASDDDAVAASFSSLFAIAQALALGENATEIVAISAGAHALSSADGADPRRALVLGPVSVIPRELPSIPCRSVDVVWPSTLSIDLVVGQIVAEIEGDAADPIVAYRGRARLVRGFEPIRLPAPTALPFKDGGVYLVTGGFGGVGLAIAEHLAKRHKATLVLVGRSPLPPRAEWAARGADARVAAVTALEALGAEVHVAPADVTNEHAMARVLADVKTRSGRLNGVIHAAGVLDDGLIQMKTVEGCLRVLAPKVTGALVLDRLLRGEHAPLDFFALFSSVSAVLGLQGQIDYAAANAFLDALAAERSLREPGLTVAIDWSAWRDVGMAARLAARGHSPTRVAEAKHRWLGDVLSDDGERIVFGRDVAREDLWVVAEHVVRGGEALVPGTGFLELARAAVAAEAVPGKAIELRNVMFLAPFVVKKDETRTLRLSLDKKSHAIAIGTASAAAGIDAVVTAEGRVVAPPATSPLDVAAIAKRCPDRTVLDDRRLPQDFMAFGPRWHVVRSMAFGDREALLELELASAFADDLALTPLHPAMMDMATGGAQKLVPGFDPARDFYVPFSYESVIVLGPLSPRSVSHVRLGKDSTKEMPTFDVTVADEAGQPKVLITGFVMKRVAAGASLTAGPVTNTSRHTMSAGTELREVAFREGMTPAEGIDAFARILAAGAGPQIVASSLDVVDWSAAIARDGSSARATEEGEKPLGGSPRPQLSTAYLAARDDGEKAVASVWQSILGIDEIGVHDNFFELGGHSLLLTQTVSRVLKVTNAELPLRALITKLTVGEMAKAIADGKTNLAPKPTAIKSVSRDAYRVSRGDLKK